MGIGMQIVYLGFPGAARIEAEAGVQLLRIARYASLLNSCHLAVEAMRGPTGEPFFDVRLDMIMRDKALVPLPHCANTDALAAVRAAFDQAERALTSDGAHSAHDG